MRVAHIIPPNWLSTFNIRSSYYMALANWAVGNPEYCRGISTISKRAYVILDNGAFEKEQVEMLGLKYAKVMTQADEVVLPDVPGDGKATLERSWEAYKSSGFERVMFVPQGNSVHEWKSCLKAWLSKWDNRAFLAIGVASLRDKDGEPIFESKHATLTYAGQFDVPIHLLGVTTPRYFIRELLPIAHRVGVRGVDTSTAFALGARKKLLTLDAPKIRLGDPEQYRALSFKDRKLINLNIAILQHRVEKCDVEEGIPESVIRSTASLYQKYFAKGFASIENVMRANCMPPGRYLHFNDRVYKLAEDEEVGKDEEVITI